MSVPFITITIASYNMGKTLPLAIRSALSQTYASFEVLVLDDGSTDLTEKTLQTFERDSRVRILRHESRQGLTQSRNRLLSEARGKLISILDADDILLPNKLSCHEALFKHHPEVGMVWGRAVIKDLQTGRFEVLPPSSYHPQWDLIEDYQAVHSATTWRKEALVRAGGYDLSRTLVEDADLFLKVGDYYKQKYSSEWVAVKYRNTKNEFRSSEREVERRTLSKLLLQETVFRRYGLTFQVQIPV